MAPVRIFGQYITSYIPFHVLWQIWILIIAFTVIKRSKHVVDDWSVYLFVYFDVVCLPFCFSMFFVCLFVCLFFGCLFICLFVYLFVCLFVCVSVCLYVYLFVCVCLFVYISCWGCFPHIETLGQTINRLLFFFFVSGDVWIKVHHDSDVIPDDIKKDLIDAIDVTSSPPQTVLTTRVKDIIT
jgi:hypothetical protein